ncbi:MAG: class I SAM-dependent methyltransferase [Anaerolineales bacterium]|nr:class I SAM-dependent methyltransferase [Anaerolineales bacterium]
MDLSKENLSGKTILEVGSGRGDTTRRLVDLLAGQPQARLIATDVSAALIADLQQSLAGRASFVDFLCTDACELAGIDASSVDYVVCNYTLCAINSLSRRAAQALRRFIEVLHPSGWLLIEEEFPLDAAASPPQLVWAEKWRILKALTLLTGGMPYQELHPDTLSAMCLQAGFAPVQWEAGLSDFLGPDSLDFFERRLRAQVPCLGIDDLISGFITLAARLKEKMARAGGMQVPYYHLWAQKPNHGQV